MKNVRQICMVKDAGELHFPTIPGTVAVGCQNTPAKASRYCSIHNTTAMVFQDDESSNDQCKSVKGSDEVGSLVIRVLNEKTTRLGKIYEVLWSNGKKSWLKETNLPLSVKECKKIGAVFEQRLVMLDELGQKRMEYQLSTSTGIQAGKVQSGEGLTSSSGFAIEVVEDNVIVDDRGQQRTMRCGTEKSKHRAKNHRTAGILAIAKPCSVVVEVKELFGSESKTQVYAHLHELLQKPSMDSIESICYDDACHLKKFAQNPVRSSLTEISERLATMEMVCDKFHFKNHTDSWCKRNCNPYDSSILQNVNTEVCEQLFSWLSKFAPITKHMNRWRFMFLMYYLVDSHNEDIERGSNWSP